MYLWSESMMYNLKCMIWWNKSSCNFLPLRYRLRDSILIRNLFMCQTLSECWNLKAIVVSWLHAGVYGLLFNSFKKNIIDQTHNLFIIKWLIHFDVPTDLTQHNIWEAILMISFLRIYRIPQVEKLFEDGFTLLSKITSAYCWKCS